LLCVGLFRRNRRSSRESAFHEPSALDKSLLFQFAADGSVACPGDVYGQTRRCLEIIAEAVVEAGLSLDTVVRTRIMLTDLSQWEAAARAHGEFFAAIRPATTFVEVQGFINREWLVEVEADCVADR